MFDSLDVERVSSIAIFGIALTLVAGIVIERANIHPQGIEYGSTVAGIVMITYAIGVILYLLPRSHTNTE